MDRPADYEDTMRERAFALILGAIVRNDLTGDIERAWRVAEMVIQAHDAADPDPADQP